MHEDDAELLGRLRSSDAAIRHAAEHELFESHRTSVDRLMRRMLGHDRDDCVQEAFFDIYRGLAGFRGSSRLSTWIYRVTLRRAWKCLAAKSRHERGRDTDPRIEEALDPKAASDVSETLAGDELARRFSAALQQLDLEQRSVMALSALDGLGPAEIAEVLGVAIGTVHSRMSRARARLRDLLGLESD